MSIGAAPAQILCAMLGLDPTVGAIFRVLSSKHLAMFDVGAMTFGEGREDLLHAIRQLLHVLFCRGRISWAAGELECPSLRPFSNWPSQRRA